MVSCTVDFLIQIACITLHPVITKEIAELYVTQNVLEVRKRVN